MALALAKTDGSEWTHLPAEFSRFRTIVTTYDAEHAALIYELLGYPRPCFTPEVLEELRSLQLLVRDYARDALPGKPIRYLIGASGAPGGVNFGGDLDFFVRCLHARDEYALAGYARMAIDLLYDNLQNLGANVTTVALVRGPTLGAAFEAALSCDVIVAEANAKLGFPEVLFNLFPGMGAYPLLARRIAPALVEKMIVSGKQYSAEDLEDLGLIDYVYQEAESGTAIDQFLRQYEKNSITRNGVLALREIEYPISKERLLRGVDVWVQSMMQISSDQVRRMESLLKLQTLRATRDRSKQE